MNTIFDALGKELSTTAKQVEDIRAIATESQDPDLESAARVLVTSELEVYSAMREMVAANPAFVEICVRALQRCEVVEFIVQKGAEHQLSGESTQMLGSLAASHAVERTNLDAFFTLFASDHPAYVQMTQAEVNTAHEDDTEDIDGSDTPKPSGREPRAESKKPDSITKLIVNGKEREVDELDACAILEMQKAQIEMHISKADPDEHLKAAVVLKNEGFNETLARITGKELTYASKASRFQKMRERLNEQFPDMFIEGGIRGGAWIIFNTEEYTVELPLTEENPDKVDEEDEPLVTTPTAVKPIEEKTWGKPARTTTAQSPGKTDPTAPRRSQTHTPPRQKKERPNGQDEVAPTTSATRLLVDGYMIDRQLTRYTDVERAALSIINCAARKEPYSPIRIATELRSAGLGASSEEIDACLKDLAGRLPRGWLVKISTGHNKEGGWRLGSGVKIRKQHGK